MNEEDVVLKKIENEIPNFIRNYIEHLEFENSALKTEHRFNIDKIEKHELKHKNLIERLEERKNKAREYMEEARKEKDKIRRSIMGRTFK